MSRGGGGLKRFIADSCLSRIAACAAAASVRAHRIFYKTAPSETKRESQLTNPFSRFRSVIPAKEGIHKEGRSALYPRRSPLASRAAS